MQLLFLKNLGLPFKTQIVQDVLFFQKEICTSNMLYNERVCNTLTDLDIHFVHKQSLADKCALKCKKIIGTNKYV